MDIQSGMAAFSLLNKALELFKQARDAMPDTKERKVASQKLVEAEKAFHIAEAKSAQELGYELCKCTWPPQIMLVCDSQKPECPACAGHSDTEALDLDGDLEREEETILKYLSATPEYNDCTPAAIAAALSISEERAKYWLERLNENEFIHYSLNMMTGTHYHLEQKGREYLIRRKLL